MKRMVSAVLVAIVLAVIPSTMQSQCAGCGESGCVYGPLEEGYANCSTMGQWCAAWGSCGGFASRMSVTGLSLAASTRIDISGESTGRTVLRDCRGYIAQRLYSEQAIASVRAATRRITI
jgi:hypothetical protein